MTDSNVPQDFPESSAERTPGGSIIRTGPKPSWKLRLRHFLHHGFRQPDFSIEKQNRRLSLQQLSGSHCQGMWPCAYSSDCQLPGTWMIADSAVRGFLTMACQDHIADILQETWPPATERMA